MMTDSLKLEENLILNYFVVLFSALCFWYLSMTIVVAMRHLISTLDVSLLYCEEAICVLHKLLDLILDLIIRFR